jgi:ubiquinone/menaquinone biosynthesis C-methylase UbiE
MERTKDTNKDHLVHAMLVSLLNWSFWIYMSFDRVAEIYDKTRGLPSEVMERLIETLTKELQGHKEILDLGVGTGRFAQPLQDAGFQVVGIDISKKMMSKAKEKDVENLLFADARLIPFRDKVFDVTISIHVLHLISEWQKVIREICRVTRDNMLSLYYAHKDPVREAYHRLLKLYGYERRDLGKSEQDLRDLVTPAKSLFVCSYDRLANDRLTNLEQRTSSSQWKIPENVNHEIVQKLRQEFAGTAYKQDLRVSIWEIESLKKHASK